MSTAVKRFIPGLKPAVLDGLRWRLFDAKDAVLGRLASQISGILQGKNKPTYAPNEDRGDVCVVVNARHVYLSGRKYTDKTYYWHTGYIGGIKERTVKEQMARDACEVLRKAVKRMLPRNKLRDDRMRKLRLFPDAAHGFEGLPLEPYEVPARNVRDMRPRERRALRRTQSGDAERANSPPRQREQ
eukprot:TRINITY_DN20293_c0_g1_i1.p1 TRINITY_DN20293_c0_g1~~TRINITY_DN20293_c0_g1_i1.p1  ORF type:complete len:186 (+),score=31.60 TRINITY_DN20293_c0_g1_i1:143-700(+)